MGEVLFKLSDDLARVVEAAAPNVVQVDARRRLPGSGIVWSPDGTIVTAHHVVEREDNISIRLPDGRTVPAALVGRDATTDVAVLRAEASDLATPTWASREGARVGHLVLALGRPGESVLATLGIVSALGDAWHSPSGGRLDYYIQTDVVMYPGFSGGPLVNSFGQVLGLNTSALLRGISLVVPVETLRRVVEALRAHGRIRRGYLGVGAQPVRLPAGLAQQLAQETGLLLVSVEAGSPAEKGGLVLGDTIVALDEHPTRHLDDLLGRLGAEQVGQRAALRVLRGGVVTDMKVTIGEKK